MSPLFQALPSALVPPRSNAAHQPVQRPVYRMAGAFSPSVGMRHTAQQQLRCHSGGDRLGGLPQAPLVVTDWARGCSALNVEG